MNLLKSLLFVVFLFSISYPNESPPPEKLISIPTAGTLDQGLWLLDIHLQKNGGILSTLSIGMTSNFNFGISYSIQNLIGNEIPYINKMVPEVQVKYRLLEETDLYPALVLGLDTQGYGTYSDSIFIKSDSTYSSRYDFKANGFYAILSKNWDFLGNLGFHFGGSLNTWEGTEDEKLPNILVGIDKDINNSFTFMADYNFGINDENNPSFDVNDKWPGFLNTGVRWSISDNLKVELCINQIRRYQKFNQMNREFRIFYRQYF